MSVHDIEAKMDAVMLAVGALYDVVAEHYQVDADVVPPHAWPDALKAVIDLDEQQLACRHRITAAVKS